ncbi:MULTISPECIES: hypothetical protein [unclassified Wolbachia]|uniref:hypothetical protein n=1 Tax=unclassified Wolbachia TaxID=2640676 RepID=UPI0003A1BCC8|nr:MULTISPECIES: hypothetical protein [unclassified Wolbachia]
MRKQKRKVIKTRRGHKAHKRELIATDKVVSCTIGTICVCGGKVTLEDEVEGRVARN